MVRGAESIIIGADGSVSGTSNIETADHVTYTFTDNIDGSILVERNDIIIDGAGYTLQGSGGFDEMGITLSGTTNVTIQNVQIANFGDGVWLQPYSNNNTVVGNTLTENDCGIQLSVSNYNSVSENVLTDNEEGILLTTANGYDTGSHYNSIIGNNITQCLFDAIDLANGSSNNTIVGNNVIDNGNGISMVTNCDDNTVSGNFVDLSVQGIELLSCDQNIISGNDIRNSGYGFYIYTSSYNDISGNNVVDSDYGVYFYKASDNKFWHNNFDNTQQVYFSGDSYANVWDDGASSGGNYWSDYAGSDANGDGIGDTPYTIDASNVDHYPLMTGFGIPVEKSFPINVGGTDYVVTTFSNSTVSDLSFNEASKQLSFSVSGTSGTIGFCDITVPAELMSGDFTLYMDDTPLVEDVDYVKSSNATHYVFSVTYTHSSHVIDLVSTEVIPDFAAWLFLPFTMAATLLGFALRKKPTKT